MAKQDAGKATWSEGLIRRWGRRKLTALTAQQQSAVDSLNARYLEAARTTAAAVHAPDSAWLINLWCSPRALGRQKGPSLPNKDLVLRAFNVIENAYTGKRRTLARRRIREGVEAMWAAHAARAIDPRWQDLPSTRLFDATDLEQWYQGVEEQAAQLRVLPSFARTEPFTQAAELVQVWDQVLAQRGHVGERFSLREELTRLHNWPGDQWDTGDDYASAQARYHRRLDKARKRGADEVRGAVMLRALYLREGLLTDPIDPLVWFLAAAAHLASHPQVLLPWGRADYNLLGEALDQWQQFRRRPRSVAALAADSLELPALPTQVPAQQLRFVSGPDLMIDVDEDVVAALPPGCQVWRLVVSRADPLGPDWLVYWVRSADSGARAIMDLVETQKLRPQILWVLDGRPATLAAVVEPHLDRAFKIPTHPLSAYQGL